MATTACLHFRAENQVPGGRPLRLSSWASSALVSGSFLAMFTRISRGHRRNEGSSLAPVGLPRMLFGLERWNHDLQHAVGRVAATMMIAARGLTAALGSARRIASGAVDDHLEGHAPGLGASASPWV